MSQKKEKRVERRRGEKSKRLCKWFRRVLARGRGGGLTRLNTAIR